MVGLRSQASLDRWKCSPCIGAISPHAVALKPPISLHSLPSGQLVCTNKCFQPLSKSKDLGRLLALAGSRGRSPIHDRAPACRRRRIRRPGRLAPFRAAQQLPQKPSFGHNLHRGWSCEADRRNDHIGSPRGFCLCRVDAAAPPRCSPLHPPLTQATRLQQGGVRWDVAGAQDRSLQAQSCAGGRVNGRDARCWGKGAEACAHTLSAQHSRQAPGRPSHKMAACLVSARAPRPRSRRCRGVGQPLTARRPARTRGVC